jgi:hypothetical protein
MTMRILVGLAAGAAAGWALARAVEARASGVPIKRALMSWDTPVRFLAGDVATRAAAAKPVKQLDPDAPMAPSWFEDDEDEAS